MKEVMECMVMSEQGSLTRVRVKLHSDCSNCGLCEGGNTVYYDAVNTVGAKPGQSVLLEIEKTNVLITAFAVFLLPLLVIAAASALGIFVAHFLGVSTTMMAVVLSILFLFPTLVLIRKYDTKVQKQSQTPVITKIIKE